jgi:signal transduction histidine kinase
VTLEREDVQLNPDDAKDLASRIAVNARKLDRMVSDLLDLDRLGRGIVEPNLVETDIGALVLKLVAGSEIVSAHEVSMEVEPVLAEVDPAKVERIIENLLSNTTRYTPPGTRVWVKVQPQNDGALIAVEDEGPGVPVELRSTIFEPFRRGPGALDHSPGVGIGLALVASFAEMHGGRAWVEDRDGGGASFRVWLPRRRPSGVVGAR